MLRAASPHFPIEIHSIEIHLIGGGEFGVIQRVESGAVAPSIAGRSGPIRWVRPGNPNRGGFQWETVLSAVDYWPQLKVALITPSLERKQR